MWSTVLSHALKYLYYIEISRASASQAIPFNGFQPSSMNSLLEVHCPHANPPLSTEDALQLTINTVGDNIGNA